VVASYVLTDCRTDLSSVIVPTVEQIRDDLLRRTEDIAEGVLAEQAAGAERAEGGAVPTIRIRIVEGAAGEVLVNRAEGADLLAVGSHGRGAVRGILLGSVALHCAMHAPGPVMVVHPQRTPSEVPQRRTERALADH